MINIGKALEGQLILCIDRYKNTKGYYKQKLIPVKSKEGNVIAVLNMVQNILV